MEVEWKVLCEQQKEGQLERKREERKCLGATAWGLRASGTAGQSSPLLSRVKKEESGKVREDTENAVCLCCSSFAKLST